jgi:hypothetical protein
LNPATDHPSASGLRPKIYGIEKAQVTVGWCTVSEHCLIKAYVWATESRCYERNPAYAPKLIEMNEEAFVRLRCEKDLKIVPGATHLFEEPGTLEKVSSLAANWFHSHLRSTDLNRLCQP